jgi:hypothetical protein
MGAADPGSRSWGDGAGIPRREPPNGNADAKTDGKTALQIMPR